MTVSRGAGAAAAAAPAFNIEVGPAAPAASPPAVARERRLLAPPTARNRKEGMRNVTLENTGAPRMYVSVPATGYRPRYDHTPHADIVESTS